MDIPLKENTMVNHFAKTLRCLAVGTALITVGMGTALGKVEPLKEKVSVHMTHVPSFGYAPVYIAMEKGYFVDRGLDVDLVIVRGADTTYQVAGKTIEFSGGAADSAFFNSLHRGMPLILISSLAQHRDDVSTNPIVVRKDLYDDGTITNVAELKGRRVANLAPGGIAEYLLGLALATENMTIADVDLVTPMGFSQIAEGLVTKAIDAGLLAEPFATMGEQRGTLKRLSDTHDLGEQMLTVKTTADYASENPEVVENFLIGLLMGARDLETNGFDDPDNLAIIEKYTKVDSDIIKNAVLPKISGTGSLNVDSIMKQQNYYQSRGYIKAKEALEPSTFIDTTYLDAAVKTLDQQ